MQSYHGWQGSSHLLVFPASFLHKTRKKEGKKVEKRIELVFQKKKRMNVTLEYIECKS